MHLTFYTMVLVLMRLVYTLVQRRFCHGYLAARVETSYFSGIHSFIKQVLLSDEVPTMYIHQYTLGVFMNKTDTNSQPSWSLHSSGRNRQCP